MKDGLDNEMTAAEKAAQDVDAATQEALHTHLAQFASLDDVGNQMRLVKRFGRTLRFGDSGVWYAYNGTTWTALKTDGPVREKAIEVTRLMQAEIDTIQDDGGAPPVAEAPDRAEAPAPEAAPPPAKAEGDKPKSEAEVKRAAYAAWRKASRSARKIADMVAMARSHPEILATQNDFDANPWLLAIENGTLNLKTRKVRPARPEDMLTRKLSVTYDAEATCPVWDAFLAKVQPDEAVREYLQRYIGYCLTGLTGEQIFLFFFGAGANGKGVFLDTMAALFADHHARIRASIIASGSAFAGEARFGLGALVGRRLITFGELEERASFNESLLKELTGQDPIEIETKGKQAYQYLPIAKYILAGNHKPRISGTDMGVWRRVRLVPFSVVVPEEERDHELRGKLLAELPGILNWALDGQEAYSRQGLGKTPQAILNATAQYREDSDVLGEFLDERCLFGADKKTPGSDLYHAYQSWSLENGHKPMANNTFANRLTDRGFTRGEGRLRRTWYGLRVREIFESLESDEKSYRETQGYSPAPKMIRDLDPSPKNGSPSPEGEAFGDDFYENFTADTAEDDSVTGW